MSELFFPNKLNINFSLISSLVNGSPLTKIINSVYSSITKFNNDFYTVGTYEPKNYDYIIGVSSIYSFWNAKMALVDNTFTFNEGVFPYSSYVSQINDPLATYDYLYSLMETTPDGFNWFDNSVRSRDEWLQAKLIPWGYNNNDFQFSLNMPFYTTDFEVDITHITQNYGTDYEFEHFPKTDDDNVIDLEAYIDFVGSELNIEWARGESLTTVLNIEVERDDNTVWPLNIEVERVFLNDETTNIEFSGGFGQYEKIDFEFDSYISVLQKAEMEFVYCLAAIDNFNIEFERDNNAVWPLNMEFHPIISDDEVLDIEFNRVYHTDDILDIEFNRVYHTDDMINLEVNSAINANYILDLEYSVVTVNNSFNFEFSRVYHTDDILDIEVDIPSIHKDYISNIEVDIPFIHKDYDLNFEFSRVYHTDDIIDLEYEVAEINVNNPLDFETLLSTFFDTELALEFLRPYELTMKSQAFVVPFGYKDDFFQLFVLAEANYGTDMEFDIPNISRDYMTSIETNIVIDEDFMTDLEFIITQINKDFALSLETNITEINKDFALPLEFQRIFIEDKITNIETDINIVADFITNLETDISINKAFELTLEYLQIISDDAILDFEINTVINMETQMNIEITIDRLNHMWGIGIEHFVSIDHDFSINLELFVNTVSKAFNLEFNILDLVYYFISKGHNILPWYSDGTGKYDSLLSTKWDKNLDDTTLDNGFLAQLQDKGITVPVELKFSDNTQDNFGLIIPGIIDNNINMQDKFLYYENLDSEHVLVLGKRKQDDQEVVNLKSGENLIIWDGIAGTFNLNIANQLTDIDNAQCYDQRDGTWRLISDTEDSELFFEHDIDGNGNFQPFPFIFNIKVTQDCSFIIYR